MIFILCSEKQKQNCNWFKQKTFSFFWGKTTTIRALLHLLFLCLNPFSSLTRVHFRTWCILGTDHFGYKINCFQNMAFQKWGENWAYRERLSWVIDYAFNFLPQAISKEEKYNKNDFLKSVCDPCDGLDIHQGLSPPVAQWRFIKRYSSQLQRHFNY